MLEAFAERVADLLPELTLVGGCTAGLLITDTAAVRVRPTLDIDLIVEAVTYVQWDEFCGKLRKLGFRPCPEPDATLCRLACEELRIDVMPIRDVLGPSNRWYESALASRPTTRLPSGATIYHIDAPHFVATKLEAFLGRGNENYVLSHDLEDVVRVMDGRPGIEEEIRRSPDELRSFLARELSRCLADRHFLEAMPGYFPGAEEGTARSRFVEGRMRAIVDEAPRERSE